MIYKREPNYRDLPSGWADMDAVKYNNIANIKGLQHIDNTMATDQSSTYSCKNVYQDESGNLTVRPALRYIRTISDEVEILGLYKTVAGEIVHFSDGTNFMLQSETYEPQAIGNGNITIQESDDKVYIMYTSVEGKLQFKQWLDGKLVDFEPDIIPNSTKNPISRLYNLLSNQLKYEVPFILPDTVTDDLFSDPNVLPIKYPDSSSIIAKTILKSGHIVIACRLLDVNTDTYNCKVLIYVPYGLTYRLIQSDINVPEDSRILIEDTLTENKIKISYSILDGKYTVIYGSYTIVYNITDSVVSFDTWKAVSSYSADNEVVAHAPGYNGTLVFVTKTPADDKCYVDVYHDGKLLKYNGLDPDGIPSTPANVLSWSATSYGSFNGIKISSKDFVVVTKNAVIRGTWNLWFSEEAVIDMLYQYSTASSFYTHYAIESYDYVYYVRQSKSYLFADIDVGDGGFIKLPQEDMVDTVMPVQNGLLFKYHSGGYHYFNPVTKYVLQSDKDIDIITADASVIMADSNIYIRVPLQQYIFADRIVSDNFPVVSELQDEVLTSFYLDNIYWFVTKHRVFGTGVANEQFSIKYFDPLKYFHFDEELTGAIRVSDSSFWVFHNNGAYLIYKSSSQIYDELSADYIEVITWLCTSTAESKGCDFDNAVITLPVSNYVACATSDDISIVQMRENVQTDDRILVPMTLDIQRFVSSLLNETESIVTGKFRYNALFFLNPANPAKHVSVLVYNAATQSWWYWELPVNAVKQAKLTETNIELLAKTNNAYCIYDFFTDYYDYTIGGITWNLYADRLLSNEPTKIDWFWESAILHFNTVDYKKQLLFTNFTFSERESSDISFEYNFEVYDREYSERSWTDVTQVVERAKTYSCKNIIAKFMYLQLYMRSTEGENFETYTRPKISTIVFKYRILPGGLL